MSSQKKGILNSIVSKLITILQDFVQKPYQIRIIFQEKLIGKNWPDLPRQNVLHMLLDEKFIIYLL